MNNDQYEHQLLKKAERFQEIANDKYFTWVRTMLSLAFGGLTALVALQEHYSPDTDLARWFLWATFASFSVSVVISAFVLQYEEKVIRDTGIQILEDLSRDSGRRKLTYGVNPPKYFSICQEALPWMFAVAITCLFLFAIANSLE